MPKNPENNANDDVLFEQLNRSKKRRRRRFWTTVIVSVLAVLVAAAVAVSVMSRRVRERFAAAAADVKSYSATVGRISTTVSGTGVLDSVDAEKVMLPAGVELDEVLAQVGDTLKEGEPIATVKMASVMTALADTQTALKDLDKQIGNSKDDSVAGYISAGITGRIKMIYAKDGDSVVDCMADHGALAVISLDGCMAVTVEAALMPRDSVTVITEDGKSYPGTVESANASTSRITLTDNGPRNGETVTVQDGEGKTLGTGTLEVHNPVSVTGYAGTISRVNVQENQQVYTGSSLFTLTDTKYSANYDALRQTRAKTEDTLRELISMLRTGSVCAPFDGTVQLVDCEEENNQLTMGYAAAASSASKSTETAVVTMAPDDQVSVTIAVDESDILALKLDQAAEITVTSLGEDTVFQGKVTDIIKVANSASGVTQYSATVVMDKNEKMLTGMTASVDVQIEGVEDAVIIPVEALHQTSNRSFVYTSYDEEAREYGGMVDVQTGVSNSNFVEITSGLKAGDTVYYTEKNNFNLFMMPGMGGMNNRNLANSRNSSSRNGK